MEHINIVIEVEKSGMFNDFLMGKPEIAEVMKSEKEDSEKTEVEAFKELPKEQKEKLVRQYVRENADVLFIDWCDIDA